jgi:hypothetical protein
VSFLAWLEQTALSVWVREAPTLWGFPFILLLHTLGLGVVAGLSVVLNVWVLKLAERHPMAPLEPFFPAIWMGFALAFISGTLLLVAYPTKALTDPVFYIKIALIVGALAQLQWLRRRVFVGQGCDQPLRRDARVRASAIAALACWFGAVVTGRFLAYTYKYLTVTDMLMGF